MKKIVPLVLLIFNIISMPSWGQKVKYKDLILMLDHGQYSEAEPHLRRYLKDNDDNPSAYIFMGITFQEKAVGEDVLKQTELIAAHCDSAVIFFNKATSIVTEKKLRNDDEYYQMFSRRDPRTGEFGIKISDVKLQLETRIKAVKERKNQVMELKKNFLKVEELYAKCLSEYKIIQAKYESNNELYLLSDDALLAGLNKLVQTFDSTINVFNSYRTLLKQIGKSDYNQVLNLQEIIDLKRDGSNIADFVVDDVRIWDYKKWAKTSLETIEKVIVPLRDSQIAYDILLNKLRAKLQKDSVSVLADVAQLENQTLYSQLKKYDENPLPIGVYEMVKAELRYQSALIIHKPTKDTSNIAVRLSYLAEEIKYITSLDSISLSLSKRDSQKDKQRYGHFITKTYGTHSVLINTINTTLDYAKREQLKKQIEWEKTIQATKWAISGTDSIPLFFEQSRELRYKPLVIVDEKFTIGLFFKDSLATGYIYSITPSRKPDMKVMFPVDQKSFKKRNLPVTKCLSASDAEGHVFFSLIYSESKSTEKFPVQISKIYRSDGLAWSNTYKFDWLPTEISFSTDTGELSVKVSSNGESKVLVIDKNGKQVQ